MSAKNKQMYHWALVGRIKESGIVEMSDSEMRLLTSTMIQRGYEVTNGSVLGIIIRKDGGTLCLKPIVADTILRNLLKFRRMP